MRKLTSSDLLTLKHNDVIAKYPSTVVVSAANVIDEREVNRLSICGRSFQ